MCVCAFVNRLQAKVRGSVFLFLDWKLEKGKYFII